MNTHGLHHVTAVTANASQNLRFYTEVLGLRLVKKTVNQDDTSAYHLFYADKMGSPGTDITFFDWEQAGPKTAGTDTISRTLFRIPSDASIKFWRKRLEDSPAKNLELCTLDSKSALLFEDPEGQALGLVSDNGAEFEGEVWTTSDLPKEHALKGFYAICLSVPFVKYIDPILAKVLNWENTGTYELDGYRYIKYCMDGGGPGKEVHVKEAVDAPPLYMSLAGTVHHAAFRVKTEEDLERWIDKMNQIGIPNSGLVDRFYFKSLYFRISQGILFELATDGPGFAADEDPEHLGEKISLPPFLESRRKEIEANLKPL